MLKDNKEQIVIRRIPLQSRRRFANLPPTSRPLSMSEIPRSKILKAQEMYKICIQEQINALIDFRVKLRSEIAMEIVNVEVVRLNQKFFNPKFDEFWQFIPAY